LYCVCFFFCLCTL